MFDLHTRSLNLEAETSASWETEGTSTKKLKVMGGILGLVVCASVVAIVSGKSPQAVNGLEYTQLDTAEEKSISGDIVGGVPVTPNEFPFRVSLQRTDLNNRHWCGGSIIGAMDVLTAALCCSGQPANQYRVVAGEQIRAVQAFTVHPEYAGGRSADVCVVRLKEPLRFNTVVQAASFPVQGAAAPAPGTAVTVLGLGETSGGASSVGLLKATVNVVSNANCTRMYNANIPANTICASAVGGGSCGDLGGPLFTADGMVVGVVSGGHPNFPGIYAEVSFFRNWIDQNSLRFSIVESNGQRCSSACPAGTAVLTGKYSGSDMYMCAVNSQNEGSRGGWNAILPKHGLDVKCGYARNGAELKSSTYDCVCSPNYRMVNANSQTCPDACSAHKLNAVPTGIDNGVATQVIYACAANWGGLGYRGGWNAMVGGHKTHCSVAGGGKEKYESAFQCVCV